MGKSAEIPKQIPQAKTPSFNWPLVTDTLLRLRL